MLESGLKHIQTFSLNICICFFPTHPKKKSIDICYQHILLTGDFWKHNQNYFGNLQSYQNMNNQENYCGITYFNEKLGPKNSLPKLWSHKLIKSEETNYFHNTHAALQGKILPLQVHNCITYRKIKILLVLSRTWSMKAWVFPFFQAVNVSSFYPIHICYHLPSIYISLISKHRKWSIKIKHFIDVTNCITILLNFHRGNYNNCQVIQLYAYFLEF